MEKSVRFRASLSLVINLIVAYLCYRGSLTVLMLMSLMEASHALIGILFPIDLNEYYRAQKMSERMPTWLRTLVAFTNYGQPLTAAGKRVKKIITLLLFGFMIFSLLSTALSLISIFIVLFALVGIVRLFLPSKSNREVI